MFDYPASPYAATGPLPDFWRRLNLSRLVWENKWLTSIAFAVSIGLAVISYLLVAPRYEASTLLLVGQNAIEESRDIVGSTSDPSAAMVRIIESDDVIRDAVEKVGLASLVDPTTSSNQGGSLAGSMFGGLFQTHAQRKVTALDRAIPSLSNALDVQREPRTGIIRVSFRHRDPATAAAFVNAIAKSFIDRLLILFGRSRAADFYQTQKQRFDDEVLRAADELREFSATNGIYSVNEERQLLLKRKNEASAALATTRGSIADKTGQKETLAAQLRLLKPVAQSPFVSSLVTTLGGGDQSPPKQADAAAERRFSDNPPLLMVRVYQEAMLSLFKVNDELAGLTNMQDVQTEELKRLDQALGKLSSKEAEFARLNRALEQASFNADIYAKRMTEEQTSAESDAAKFSSVRIVQNANVPFRPVAPSFALFMGFGVLAGLIISIAAALARDANVHSDRALGVLTNAPPLSPDSAKQSKPRRQKGAYGFDILQVRGIWRGSEDAE